MYKCYMQMKLLKVHINTRCCMKSFSLVFNPIQFSHSRAADHKINKNYHKLNCSLDKQ